MQPRYLRDLSIQYRPHPERLMLSPLSMKTPRDAAAVLDRLIGHQHQEVFGALLLNTKGQILCYREVCRGSLAAVEVHPRDVLIPALLVNAASIIAAHNHPSGDPEPSPDDIALTARLLAACLVIEVDLYDHIIIGDGGYFSFRESGRI